MYVYNVCVSRDMSEAESAEANQRQEKQDSPCLSP